MWFYIKYKKWQFVSCAPLTSLVLATLIIKFINETGLLCYSTKSWPFTQMQIHVINHIGKVKLWYMRKMCLCHWGRWPGLPDFQTPHSLLSGYPWSCSRRWLWSNWSCCDMWGWSMEETYKSYLQRYLWEFRGFRMTLDQSTNPSINLLCKLIYALITHLKWSGDIDYHEINTAKALCLTQGGEPTNDEYKKMTRPI